MPPKQPRSKRPEKPERFIPIAPAPASRQRSIAPSASAPAATLAPSDAGHAANAARRRFRTEDCRGTPYTGFSPENSRSMIKGEMRHPVTRPTSYRERAKASADTGVREASRGDGKRWAHKTSDTTCRATEELEKPWEQTLERLRRGFRKLEVEIAQEDESVIEDIFTGLATSMMGGVTDVGVSHAIPARINGVRLALDQIIRKHGCSADNRRQSAELPLIQTVLNHVPSTPRPGQACPPVPPAAKCTSTTPGQDGSSSHSPEPVSREDSDRGGASDSSHDSYHRSDNDRVKTTPVADPGPRTSQSRRDTAPNDPSSQPPNAPRLPLSQRDEETSNRRGDDDGEVREEQQGSVESENETRPRKRRKTSASRTLDDTYYSIDKQPNIARCNDEGVFRMSDVARQLTSEVRDTSKNPEKDFPERDLSILLSVMLVDIFGKSGLTNLDRLLHDHGKDHSHNVWAVTCQGAAGQGLPMIDKPELASLYKDWAYIVGVEDASRSCVGRLLLMKYKLNVVRRWDEFKKLSLREQESLSKFLDKEGFPKPDDPKAKCSLITRLGNYMAKLLRLHGARCFSDRIYRWKPLAILVETFGEGILPLVTPKLEVSIRGLRSDGEMLKIRKFAAFVKQLSKKLPRLSEACLWLDVNVTQPILTGKPFQFDTKAIRVVLTRAEVVQDGYVDQMNPTVFESLQGVLAGSVQEGVESGNAEVQPPQDKERDVSGSLFLAQPLVIDD